jgi:uncharacterized MAPEG superfamily protein
MTTELRLLAVAVLIGLAHLLWAAGASRAQQGLKWAGGPRDVDRPVTGRAARLNRAFANFRETFPLFAAAILAAHLGDQLGPLTFWGAWLYVVARALYLPLYAYPVGLLRSLAWFAAMAGLGLVTAALFV